jgi:hypothetical protein
MNLLFSFIMHAHIYRKADVMVGGLYENQISRKLLSSSIPYYQDDITWCVAKAGLAPKWMNVFVIFNSKKIEFQNFFN